MRSREREGVLRNVSKNALFIMLFGVFLLLVLICLTASTSHGKERSERTGEPYKTAEPKSVGDDAGQTLSTYNRAISVAILIAAAIFAVYCLRTTNKTRGRQKTDRGRIFTRGRK
jgi:hypothetical protein